MKSNVGEIQIQPARYLGIVSGIVGTSIPQSTYLPVGRLLRYVYLSRYKTHVWIEGRVNRGRYTWRIWAVPGATYMLSVYASSKFPR